MASSSSLSIVIICSLLASISCACNFYQDFDINWGDQRGKILNNGQLLNLSLDSISGSGFQSKGEFLFGNIDMQIKLVPGNSAGTVTAYYDCFPISLYIYSSLEKNWKNVYQGDAEKNEKLSSLGPTHDEIDFEFLGNLSGQPYTIHTNVYTQGKGEREQQFQLWFDPRDDFHTYSVHWNPSTIILLVDNIPIREFKNLEKSKGVAFPISQPMRVYSSIYNADEWATRGGLVKTDWTHAPFVASYRGFSSSAWDNDHLDIIGERKLKWVQKKYMIYDYCTNKRRFPQGFPPECQPNS